MNLMCQTSTSPFAFAFTVAFPVLSLFSFSSLSSPLSNVAFLPSFLLPLPPALFSLLFSVLLLLFPFFYPFSLTFF